MFQNPQSLKQISLSVVISAINQDFKAEIRRKEVTEECDGIPLLTLHLRLKIRSGKISNTFATNAITERLNNLPFVTDKTSLLNAFPSLPTSLLIVIRNNILKSVLISELYSEEPLTLWSLLYSAQNHLN